MVSRLPTYSLKGVRVPHKFVVPLLLLFVLLAGFAVDSPWATLTVVLLLYVCSLPLSLITFRRLQRRTPADAETPPAGAEAAGIVHGIDLDKEVTDTARRH